VIAVVDGPTATQAAVRAVSEVLSSYGVPEGELRRLANTIVARVAPVLAEGWRAEQPAPVVLPAPTADPESTHPLGINRRRIEEFDAAVARLRSPGPVPGAEPGTAPAPLAAPERDVATPAVTAEGFESRATILHAWRNRYVVLAPTVRRVRGRRRAQRLADRALARAADAQLSLVEVRRLPRPEVRP